MAVTCNMILKTLTGPNQHFLSCMTSRNKPHAVMSGQITGKAQCVSLLQDCLALQLQRVGPPSGGSPHPPRPPPSQDPQYWMYDSGYLIFQVYQTAQGYFVATPDSVRLTEAATGGGRNLLLSQAEAAALVHGEIVTIREGHKTHQSIQTNLADVICGGT
ncbi:unnamed protein product [Nesidiocoris tenuis]|uniref:Uncharacterized protein n=1 Tax=Nesidiocoris tenuis TaxID=355587 RepID=A0A6H5HDB1_9HEMI|nr:unnamed protein product [Nesidiocoris tenuis]